MIHRKGVSVRHQNRPSRLEPLEARRLLAFSYLDPTYGNPTAGPLFPGRSASELVPLADGSLMYAGADSTSFTVGKLLSDGKTLDTSFNGTGFRTIPTQTFPLLTDLLLLADGSIRIAASNQGIVRVYAWDASGADVPGFGSGGFLSFGLAGRNLYGYGMALAPGGALYIAGSATNGGIYDSSDSMIARVGTDGLLDPTFGVRVVDRGQDATMGYFDMFSDVVVQPDGTPVTFGRYHWSYGRGKAARFSNTGVMDPAWPSGPFGGEISYVHDSGQMKVDALGRIYISVDASISSGTTLIRLNPSDGALDRSYGDQGYANLRPVANSEMWNPQFALAPDGSAFTLSNLRNSGYPSHTLLSSLDASGRLVRTFAASGQYKITPPEFEGGLGSLRGIVFEDANHLIVSGAKDGSSGSFFDRYQIQDASNVYSTATGLVFDDRNGNGVKDAGEPFRGIGMYEDENNNERLDEFERVVYSSSATGIFTMTNLAAGEHRIRPDLWGPMDVITAGPDNGYVFTTISSPGSVVSGLDYGVQTLNGVDGRLFDDRDLSGTRSESEPYVQGRIIYLDTNLNGRHDPDEPSSTTDAEGRFSLLGVPEGNHSIRQVLPEGWLSTWTYVTPQMVHVYPNSVTNAGLSTYQPATLAPRAQRVNVDLYSTNLGMYVDVVFSEDVSASLTVQDFIVREVRTGTRLPSSEMRLEVLSLDGKTYARLWFEPVLASGSWGVEIEPSSVVDVANNPLNAWVAAPFLYLHADITLDNVVDFTDLLSLAQRWGMTGRTYTQGNIDRDPEGRVDFNDLLILAQHFETRLSVAQMAPTTRRKSGRAADIVV